MENVRPVKNIHIHFLLPDLRVGAGFSRKRKSALSVFIYIYKCQCCEISLIHDKTADIYIFLFQHGSEKLPVHICSRFPEKCSPGAEP